MPSAVWNGSAMKHLTLSAKKRPRACFPFRLLAFRTLSYYPARNFAREDTLRTSENDRWQVQSRFAWQSSAWVSGRNLSRSIRNTQVPRSMESAGATGKGSTRSATAMASRPATTEYRDLLKDSDIDAVHINSPIPDHAWMSVEALNAGKHVACTVPMGTSIDECRQIVEAQRKSGKIYMMMETVVYSREYLFVKELYDKGELGRLQFLRGSHQQDMDGWPDYWPGLPPMWYATHCVSPCLAILGKHAQHVVCHGSGRIREELIGRYGSPFAIETATFAIKDSDVAAEVTRSLFDVARQYRESFDAYGSKKSFEWQQVENEDPVIHTKSTPGNLWPNPRSPNG